MTEKTVGISFDIEENAEDRQVATQDTTAEIKRDTFRIPCQGPEDCDAIIENIHYNVVNIGSKGLGLLCPASSPFVEGAFFEAITLVLQNQSFLLKGRIVHISYLDADRLLCGIELLEMSQEIEQKLRTVLMGRRKDLFVTAPKEGW